MHEDSPYVHTVNKARKNAESQEARSIACIRTLHIGAATVHVMDDDLASPEEQKAIQKRLQGIAWEVKNRLAKSLQTHMDATEAVKAEQP